MPKTIGAIELASDSAGRECWQRLVHAPSIRRPFVEPSETVLHADLSALKQDLHEAYRELRQQLPQR